MRVIQTAILALLAATFANAQSNLPALRADIPFAFEMRGVTLTGGEYRIDFSENRSWITVKSMENARDSALGVTFSVTLDKKTPGEAKLVFNKYGDRYFLSQIWHPAIARELPKSKQERELVTSRVVAQIPVRVVVAAKVMR
ncbi:MAG: hypothetical protein U0R19_13340 [Bryobacteraceae bacterium]